MPPIIHKPGEEAHPARRKMRALERLLADGIEMKEIKKIDIALPQGYTAVEIIHPRGNPIFGRSLEIYRKAFPNPDEREDDESIFDRLENKEEGYNNLFHAISILDERGRVVGYSQFTVMPISEEKVVVYAQYSCIRERVRGRGLYKAIWDIRHAIAKESGKEVIGTMFETEFVGQADDEEGIRFTRQRHEVFAKIGAMAVMIELEDGTWLNPIIQPRLSADTNPIMLHMFFRPFSEEASKVEREMDRELAKRIALAYIDNFEREGFDKNDVDEARKEVLGRFERAKRVLLIPPQRLPTIIELAKSDPVLMKQIERDYGSFESHAKLVERALKEQGAEPKGIVE